MASHTPPLSIETFCLLIGLLVLLLCAMVSRVVLVRDYIIYKYENM